MKYLSDFMDTDITGHTLDERVSPSQFQNIERFADKLFKHLGIDVEFTKHFKDRTNDKRNKPDITGQELIDFFKAAFVKHGKQIAAMKIDREGILKDIHSDVNLPFVMSFDKRNNEIDLVAKTIMRKKDFKSHGQKIMRF